MTNSNTQDKRLSQNQTQTTNNQNNTLDNKTKVYIRLDEPKITVSFRCNRELWKSFKKQIRAQGLSICHVLEPMILGWLNGYVNICDTIKPLKIENLVVERAVKRVRRYAVEENEEREVDNGFCWYCFNVNGRKHSRVRAVGLFRYDKTGEVYGLCSFHAKELLSYGGWSHV